MVYAAGGDQGGMLYLSPKDRPDPGAARSLEKLEMAVRRPMIGERERIEPEK